MEERKGVAKWFTKRTALFSATVVTNTSGNRFPSLLLLSLNYSVVVATYSILVYVAYAEPEYVSIRIRIPHK